MRCPICCSQEVTEGLFLARQPVYQHPVPPSAEVPGPWFKDLAYWFCPGCGHGFLADDDTKILERLYRHYYYTPRPPDMGIQFQETFFRVADQVFNVLSGAEAVVEIGCSSGEVLGNIGRAYPKICLAGFEPNRETARKAAASGICISPEFLCPDSAAQLGQTFDLVFHRNVIEHIQDHDRFLKAQEMLCRGNAHLVIETPCLDLAVRDVTLAPFHIEHRHVFSLGSIQVLMKKWGWHLGAYELTGNQAMICHFTRAQPARDLHRPGIRSLAPLEGWIRENRARIANAARGRRLAVWGAGSGGVKVINYFGLDPEVLVDTNPQKVGKYFLGFDHLAIAEAGAWVARERADSRQWLIVVASSYEKEIRAYLASRGWQGEVVCPYG